MAAVRGGGAAFAGETWTMQCRSLDGTGRRGCVCQLAGACGNLSLLQFVMGARNHSPRPINESYRRGTVAASPRVNSECPAIGASATYPSPSHSCDVLGGLGLGPWYLCWLDRHAL